MGRRDRLLFKHPSLRSASLSLNGPAVLLPHQRVMLEWGECQAEHRHVQEIKFDRYHHSDRYAFFGLILLQELTFWATHCSAHPS
jgi:hypothetical protein